MENAQGYADIIIEDDLNRIVSEKTITYEQSFIERNYEFEDGAVVKYEWRGFPDSKDSFNHKFTLITPPKPNPNKIKKGLIRAIEFSR